MRTKFVAGNWKMNTTREAAVALAAGIAQGVTDTQVTVAVCPPFPYLSAVVEAVKDSPVAVGGQNLYPEESGAFTGEVSAAMLRDIGCDYVILGHSERRHILGETDEFINRKVKLALKTGLRVILCIGELLEERENNQTEQVLETQLTHSLADLTAADLANITLAYEPVWAIGTGKTATPDQAQQAHRFVRDFLRTMFDANTADNLVIQYGGSVKPDNAATLLSQPDVDGALVGGASMKVDSFLGIVRGAK